MGWIPDDSDVLWPTTKEEAITLWKGTEALVARKERVINSAERLIEKMRGQLATNNLLLKAAPEAQKANLALLGEADRFLSLVQMKGA